MHSLDDVPAIVEHPPDVLCVHGTGEVGVAVVSAVATRSADPLRRGDGALIRQLFRLVQGFPLELIDNFLGIYLFLDVVNDANAN